MTDYHKQKIREQGREIAKLEEELARVKAECMASLNYINAISEWVFRMPVFDSKFPQALTELLQKQGDERG